MPPVSQPPRGASGQVCRLRTAILNDTSLPACIGDRAVHAKRAIYQAAFFSAFRHLVQRNSLLVSFLWKVWPQLMQISRPLSFLPMPRLWRAEGVLGKSPADS